MKEINGEIVTFYSKTFNKKYTIERVYGIEWAKDLYNQGSYIWIFPKCVLIGSGMECRVGGKHRYFAGTTTFNQMVENFRKSIAGFKNQDLIFYEQIKEF